MTPDEKQVLINFIEYLSWDDFQDLDKYTKNDEQALMLKSALLKIKRFLNFQGYTENTSPILED